MFVICLLRLLWFCVIICQAALVKVICTPNLMTAFGATIVSTDVSLSDVCSTQNSLAVNHISFDHVILWLCFDCAVSFSSPLCKNQEQLVVMEHSLWGHGYKLSHWNTKTTHRLHQPHNPTRPSYSLPVSFLDIKWPCTHMNTHTHDRSCSQMSWHLSKCGRTVPAQEI